MRKIVLFVICACFLINPIYSETIQEFQAKQAKEVKKFEQENAQKRKKYEQEQLQKYKKYKSKKQQEFDAYRRSVNEKFAEMMKKKWMKHPKKAAIPVPKSKEPPKPYVYTEKDDKRTTAVKLGYSKIVNAERYEELKPIAPVVGINEGGDPIMASSDAEPTQTDFEQQYKFLYHGRTCKAHFYDSMRFSLPDVSEASVAEVWKQLSSEDFDPLLADCFDLKDDMRLGDWGYIDMLRVMSEHFLGESNEAVLLQMYVLAQSGYKVRIARSDDKLFLLVPFRTIFYGHTIIVLGDGKHYYVLGNKESRNQSRYYYVYEESFPRERTASLKMPGTPKLGKESGVNKLFQSRRYEDTFAQVVTNKNLIDFYNDYPVSSNWDEYVRTSLSDEVKNSLYPALRAQINGKTKLQAANILINFVQTAFQYMTDQEQFGYERPLFGDETFYYPYSDCEDRSILFAILVRELLGLDVVLLHYPQHLATAVDYGDEEVGGYYFNVDGKKYTVSDPTYINAPVGSCMPQYQNSSAEIIKI